MYVRGWPPDTLVIWSKVLTFFLSEYQESTSKCYIHQCISFRNSYPQLNSSFFFWPVIFYHNHENLELTHIDTLNSLWPSDDIWRQRSGSTLAQVMACCLTAPSHYLNQCWLIISKTQLHSSDGKSQEIHQSSMAKINMKITHLKCY